MKLFYVPGSCSRSPHIVLNELGIKFEVERLDPKNKNVAEGDYYKLNPKGQVPALKLDNGEILTEGVAITQYLADLKPELKLAPALGSMERYRLMEWMNFIATEVHKGFSPLFNPKTPDDMKEQARANLGKRFDYVTEQLKDNKYLMGSQFTIADAYFFTVVGWSKRLGLDMSKWPKLMALCERIEQRPAVQATLKAEQ